MFTSIHINETMMKQATILLLIIFGNNFLFCQSDISQIELHREKKQTVTLSYSQMIMGNFNDLFANFHLDYTDRSTSNNQRYGVVRGEFGVKAVFYRHDNLGTFSVAYGRHLTKKIMLTASLSYMHFSRKWDLYVDANSPHYFTERFHLFQFMPEVQYNYLTTKDGSTSLFLAAGLGIAQMHNNVGRFGDVITSKKGANLAYQVWLFGLQGKVEDVIINFRLGHGTRGILELGLGYRF